MKASIIGISSGIVIIIIFAVLKRFDKKIIYGLILAGIGFLYVGFTWSDFDLLIITSVQAIFFVFLAYWGMKGNLYFLAAGYFLHGLWDIVYGQVADTALIPPHYDLFCLTIDFTIGLYLLFLKYRSRAGNASKVTV